jgi:hypothetical protein
VWFTRASILYDYCLMLRALPDHVQRTDPDTVVIERWHDPILDKRLPETPDQLHGITFYVADKERASVVVDGEPVEDLCRNRADETGQESVSVLGTGAIHALFDELDPMRNHGSVEQEALSYRWVEDAEGAYSGRAHARLTPEAGELGRFSWRPVDLTPIGTQYFGYALRPSSAGVRAGVLVETVTGGRFYFGDDAGQAERLQATARYLFAPPPAGSWRMRWAPFYDLDWAPGATPGGPLPSHAVARVSLLVEGGAADTDRMLFMRPSTTMRARRNGCVVMGEAPLGATVQLTYESPEGERREVRQTADGFFLFSGIPEGSVATVSCDQEGITREIETCGDRVFLSLE